MKLEPTLPADRTVLLTEQSREQPLPYNTPSAIREDSLSTAKAISLCSNSSIIIFIGA